MASCEIFVTTSIWTVFERASLSFSSCWDLRVPIGKMRNWEIRKLGVGGVWQRGNWGIGTLADWAIGYLGNVSGVGSWEIVKLGNWGIGTLKDRDC